MSEQTPVVNIYHLKEGWEDDPNYVYIGRPGKGKPGPFGNPYYLVPSDGGRRGATLDQYKDYLDQRILTEQDFRLAVKDLHGKTLVCFCKPKACHGDWLSKAADILHAIYEEVDSDDAADE
jgi:hypothetical protein